MVAMAQQVGADAAAEGPGFRETAGELAQPFDAIGQRQEVARPQGAQAVGEQVQAGDMNELHPRIQLRVGRTGQHVNPVSGLDQGLAQVVQVDTLPAPMRLAAVAEQGDMQGVTLRGGVTRGAEMGSARV